MAIFANPTPSEIPSQSGINILFLHGLEGSPEGQKAVHLKRKWGANVPKLRTEMLRDLKSKFSGTAWKEMPEAQLKTAFDKVYLDALSALNYIKPDIVIGSSLGGAILARMLIEGKWLGNSIFLAPAIDPLLGDVTLPETRNSVWILGELDTEVPNGPNVYHCLKSGGSLVVMESEGHRLPKAVTSGLLDNAITTVIEIDQVKSRV